MTYYDTTNMAVSLTDDSFVVNKARHFFDRLFLDYFAQTIRPVAEIQNENTTLETCFLTDCWTGEI